MVLSLNDEELAFFVGAVSNGTASMEQVGAFLMATYINGMTKREKVAFTKYMMHSGFVFEWKVSFQMIVIWLSITFHGVS